MAVPCTAENEPMANKMTGMRSDKISDLGPMTTLYLGMRAVMARQVGLVQVKPVTQGEEKP